MEQKQLLALEERLLAQFEERFHAQKQEFVDLLAKNNQLWETKFASLQTKLLKLTVDEWDHHSQHLNSQTQTKKTSITTSGKRRFGRGKKAESKPDLNENVETTDDSLKSSQSDDFQVESGTNAEVNNSHHNPWVERKEMNKRYYHDRFSQKGHSIFIGEQTGGPVIICTVDNDQGNTEALIFTKNGTLITPLPKSKKKSKKDSLRYLVPGLEGSTLKQLTGDTSEIETNLLQLEQQGAAAYSQYKFGVLCCTKDNQTEDEMFSIDNVSPKFERFLDLVGDKIELEGWTQFRGGLDVKQKSTGTHSYYTTYNSYEIMLHVSAFLPHSEADTQQLERKRHLGNDVVVLVFKEHDGPFSPAIIRSHVNSVFLIVSEVVVDGNLKYEINVASKQGVPSFGPYLPDPPLFAASSEFRDFLLCKMINGERAAMASPEYSEKLARARMAQLSNIIDLAQTSTQNSKKQGKRRTKLMTQLLSPRDSVDEDAFPVVERSVSLRATSPNLSGQLDAIRAEGPPPLLPPPSMSNRKLTRVTSEQLRQHHLLDPPSPRKGATQSPRGKKGHERSKSSSGKVRLT